MSKRSKSKNKSKIITAVTVILVIIIVAAVVLRFAKPDLFHKISGMGDHFWTEWEVIEEANCSTDGKKHRECSVCGGEQTEVIPATGLHSYNGNNICTVCGYDNNAPSEDGIATAQLSIHFLELGNANAGDCTLIKCGSTEVLIDAGSKRNSTATVKSYISKYCTDGVLEYVIATHAHEDHIAALAGNSGMNDGVLYSFGIGTIIQFAGHKTTSGIYNDYVAATEYAASKGTKVYTAYQCWNNTDGAQRQYYLDSENKISLNILYQKYYEQTTTNENNYSVCTLLSQKIDENNTYNYLFTGDLEKAGEESLVESNDLPGCKLFKGGHHGSSTSSNDVLLNVIRPESIAICTCAGTYEYAEKPNTKPNYKPEEVAKLSTFPTQEAIDRMAKWTDKIYVTTLGILNDDYSTKQPVSMNGTIVFYYDTRLKLYCSDNDTVLKDTEWFKNNRTWNGSN